MTEDIVVSRNKQIRGHILRTLNISPFVPVNSRTLAEGLMAAKLISSFDIRAYLRYLEDKEYITIVEVEPGDSGDWIVNITSDGVDLVEHSIPDDPGVTIRK